MDHDSARIDAGANVPFALLAAVGLPSLVLREAMSVGALERCHTRADVESSKPRVRIDLSALFRQPRRPGSPAFWFRSEKVC